MLRARDAAKSSQARETATPVHRSALEISDSDTLDMKAEKLLYRLGYLKEAPDGFIRGNTTSAILDYEVEHGMPLNGEVTPELVEHLLRTAERRNK